MVQSRGSRGLMALVALVPFVVISTILFQGGEVERPTNGRTSREKRQVEGLSRGAKERQHGRRLQTSYNFATQLEMTVCLSQDHSSDSAQSTPDQFKAAVVAALGLADEDLVKVDDSLTRCVIDGWQRRVSVYNEADEENEKTAADIASEQVDRIYIDPGTSEFFADVAAEINVLDPKLETKAEDFDLESLGFLVIWLDTSGEVISSQSTTKSKDVVTIGGTDVWWPWWAWLIYAGVVVCCICPMLFFFFKWRRDKEAEEEGFGAPGGKDLGTPAPPSATSTNPNPYGGNYSTGEEYKNGQ